jgi:hypothetical protein
MCDSFCRFLRVIALSSALLLTDSASAGGQSEDGLQQFGDIIEILLPADAGLSTFLAGDGEGSMRSREIDTRELRNRVSYALLMLGFAHSRR